MFLYHGQSKSKTKTNPRQYRVLVQETTYFSLFFTITPYSMLLCLSLLKFTITNHNSQYYKLDPSPLHILVRKAQPLRLPSYHRAVWPQDLVMTIRRNFELLQQTIWNILHVSISNFHIKMKCSKWLGFTLYNMNLVN